MAKATPHTDTTVPHISASETDIVKALLNTPPPPASAKSTRRRSRRSTWPAAEDTMRGQLPLELKEDDQIEIRVAADREFEVSRDRSRRASRSIEKRSMSDKVFFDTNVLLYTIGQHDARTPTAEALLARGGLISVQVLNELASVAHRKLQMSWPEVTEPFGSCVRRGSRSPRRCMTRPCAWRGSTASPSTTRSSSRRHSKRTAPRSIQKTCSPAR